jgi:hypothetical protein
MQQKTLELLGTTKSTRELNMLSQTFSDILTDQKVGSWFNAKRYDFRTLEHLTELGLLEMQVDYMRRVIWFRRPQESRNIYWREWKRSKRSKGMAQTLPSCRTPYNIAKVRERQKAYNLRRKAEKAA